VSAITLLLSWLAAVIVIPCWVPDLSEHPTAARSHAAVKGMHRTAESIMISTTRASTAPAAGSLVCRSPPAVLIVTLIVFVVSLAAFKLVPQQFFPSSDRPS